jgi:hypothetical protein
MSQAGGHDNAALVPPLQLARGDARQCDELIRCKVTLHLAQFLFQTNQDENV